MTHTLLTPNSADQKCCRCRPTASLVALKIFSFSAITLLTIMAVFIGAAPTLDAANESCHDSWDGNDWSQNPCYSDADDIPDQLLVGIIVTSSVGGAALVISIGLYLGRRTLLDLPAKKPKVVRVGCCKTPLSLTEAKRFGYIFLVISYICMVGGITTLCIGAYVAVSVLHSALWVTGVNDLGNYLYDQYRLSENMIFAASQIMIPISFGLFLISCFLFACRRYNKHYLQSQSEEAQQGLIDVLYTAEVESDNLSKPSDIYSSEFTA